jgi:hypothetical protein
MDGLVRRWLPLLLVVAALSIAGLAAAAGTGLSGGLLPPPEEDTALPPEESTPQATGSPPADGPGQARDPEVEFPGWLTWSATVLFLGLVVGVVGLFLYVGARYLLTERVIRRQLRDRAASQPAGQVDPEAVRAAVRAGLVDIDAGGDPRRAVIACWLRLERLAAAAGTARLAADTPADLVARLLAAHRVGERALGRLAGAYRLARYAPAEVGEQLLVTAREALREVDAELVPGPPVAARR